MNRANEPARRVKTTITSLAGVLFSIAMCLMLPSSIRADTVNINSINANSSPFFVDISTTNLLAQYSITLANVTPGTTVAVACGECGGNSVVPSSPPNVLTQFGNDNGMSYTLQFPTPLSTLSFNLAGNSKSGGSGTVVAAWSATAFDASGNVVSSVGDPSLFSTFSPFAPQPFTLTGPGIASVTFFTQCFNFCGTLLNIDDLSAPEIKLASCSSQPCILTPHDGASPLSHFVALSGTGVPGDLLTVLVGNISAGSVAVGSDGSWEALPDVSLFGSSVQVEVVDQTTSNASNTITINPQIAGLLPGPQVPRLSRLLPLRHADIFLGSDPNSLQVDLYGPKWTHTALYLGGDANGTPMVAEAVTPGETSATGQQVRSVSLETSLLWTGARISGFGLRNALTNSGRDAVVAWAETVTNRGLPYWSPLELALPAKAVLDWTPLDPTSLAFVLDLNDLNALKNSTSQFICSTLVWAAYWNGTGQTVDISDPNNMTIKGLSILGALTFLRDRPLFLDELRPVFVVPETFARSPNLNQIF